MQQARSGLVWLISAGALALYAVLGLLGVGIPGIEELVFWLSKAEGWEFMVAGFLAITLEGLYVIGNFFPGTTTVLLLAILSSVGSWWYFFGTITAIFIGWCIAGVVNILIAYRTLKKYHGDSEHVFIVRDNFWLTWLPAFRANYEVSQIAAGGNVWKVLCSALRVRFYATVLAGCIAAIAAYMIELDSLDNEEGFASLLLIVVIMVFVGIREMRKISPESDERIN